MIGLLVTGLFVLAACAPAATATATEAPMTSTPAVEPEPSVTPEPIHLKVGVLSYLSNAPLFIAQEEGYFTEQALEVEFVDFGFSDRDMIPALLQRNLDVAAASLSAGILNGIEQGGTLRLVADKGFANPQACADAGWLAATALLESGELDQPADLRGRNVVAFTGNTFEYTHDLLLEQAGLTNEDMQIQAVFDGAARIEGLANGSIDVTLHSEPWISRARETGVAGLWLPFSAVIPNESVAAIVYGPGLLEGDPDAGIRFMTAYMKAVQHFTGDKTGRNIEIIAQYTKLTPEEIEQACWTSYQPDGKIDQAGLERFEQWAVDKGYISSPLDLEQIWDSRFVDEALARLEK
jgi:NitT/TauT family transport system substrate-binding protein